MKKAISTLFCIAVIIGLMIPASGLALAQGTYYVDDDHGNPYPGTGTPTDPFHEIQLAIAASPSGHTVSVAAGTYAPPLTIDRNVAIVGAGSDVVFVTGGIQITGSFSGLTLEGMSLSGDAPGYNNAVIDSQPTTGPVSNITIRDCVLDGNNVSGRAAFYGHFITGTWTWDGNELKNFVFWYVIDNTGSTAAVPYKLTRVVFRNNYVHDVAGSIAFRGKIGQEIETAVVSGNTIDYSMISSAQSQSWAAVEVNNVLDLQVFSNTVTGVPEASWGGDGQAFQFWSVAPWTVSIHDNDLSGNYQGIWISGYLNHPPGYNTYIPSGTVSNNDFGSDTDFAIWISDSPPGSGTSSAIGQPYLDARGNWWGDPLGPTDNSDDTGSGGWYNPGPPTSGDAVSDKVRYDQWLTEAQGAGAGTGGGCFIATSALGPDDGSVRTLRTFRDSHLATNAVGSGFVSAYYKLSPPVAGFIDEHSALKPVVRAALLPSVGISEAAVGMSLAVKAVIVGLMLVASVLAALSLRRGGVPGKA